MQQIHSAMAKQAAITVPEGCTRVLLHACCAPCSSAIVEWLLAHRIEPVIYYYNPNIYPQEEYEIRKNESKRHAQSLGIRWIDDDRIASGGKKPCGQKASGGKQPCGQKASENAVSDRDGYDEAHEQWREAVCGLEHEPERGKRCEACFYHRLFATARKAKELGIPFFATTLASSRWKNLEQINAAGEAAAATANDETQPDAIRFWAQNWRKDGLQERRNELLKEYNFYNQKYCGCEFSQPQ